DPVPNPSPLLVHPLRRHTAHTCLIYDYLLYLLRVRRGFVRRAQDGSSPAPCAGTGLVDHAESDGLEYRAHLLHDEAAVFAGLFVDEVDHVGQVAARLLELLLVDLAPDGVDLRFHAVPVLLYALLAHASLPVFVA